REAKIAAENATKNRSVALAALKRKKLAESQLEQMNGTRMTLETQISAIETANVNLETMKAMRQGADAMKYIHKDMNIDKVDQTMDEIREQMDLANEVSVAISQPEIMGMTADDSDILAELELLEQEQLDKQILSAAKPPTTGVKVTPAKELPAVDEEEDAELAELRESMGIAN
ncbi:hypothetical protein BB560_006435, partial [Smittium megazygosporum]